MRRFLAIGLLVFLAAMAAKAQQRIPCDRGAWSEASVGRASTRGTIYESSVSSREGQYHVPVVLAAFKDVPFTTPNVEKEWDAMLNEPGFSKHGAVGCVSEYFMIQSGGKFQLTFDVMGPVTLPDSMKYYGANYSGRQGNDKRPAQMVWDACQATGKDFSPYDWNTDGTVDAVMIIFAGHGENRGGPSDAIWPHKFNVFGVGKVGDVSLYSYACISELGLTEALDGYGTFIHEFSHCLGLPDLYPTEGSVYSYFDEWDLMDGGNYANNGWSPPHYSAFERQLCGWFEPVELTSAASISGLPSFDEEPVAYLIRNDADPKEYYLLENRQQRGWDAYVPGNGLLITHINNYRGTLNANTSSRAQVGLVYADNRNYHQSAQYFPSMYTEDGHNLYLSLSAYPYEEGESFNDCLTDASTPAMNFAGKPVTNIRMSADGTISFDFMKSTGIDHPLQFGDTAVEAWYDLQGRRLPAPPHAKGIYILRRGKTISKIIKP